MEEILIEAINKPIETAAGYFNYTTDSSKSDSEQSASSSSFEVDLALVPIISPVLDQSFTE